MSVITTINLPFFKGKRSLEKAVMLKIKENPICVLQYQKYPKNKVIHVESENTFPI